MTIPLIYITILNYKNYVDTIECVHTVESINYQNYRIVIVDNNSGNGSEEILRKNFPHHIFIQTRSNRGYAAGNNAGIKIALKAGADYVLILNNDTKVKQDFLDKLVAYAESNLNVGVLGPKIIDESGNLDITCARRRPTFADYFWRIGPGKRLIPNNRWIRAHYYIDEYDFNGVKEVDIISGSCMLIRCELLQKIGLLDEKTFLFLEEFILHEKVRKTKYSTVIVPDSVIVHKRHASITGKKYRATWESFKSLNYYLWYYRNFGKIANILALSIAAIQVSASFLHMFVASSFQTVRALMK